MHASLFVSRFTAARASADPNGIAFRPSTRPRRAHGSGRAAGAWLTALALAMTCRAAQFAEPIILTSPNAQGNGWFGAEGVDWVPDMNGDGIADIAVGAMGEYSEEGRVYVFDGASREVVTELRAPIIGAGINFGARVAGIADLNGNGSGDLVVATGAGQNRVYVVDGATGALIHQVNRRGRSISAVPDTNDDGLPEFLVSGDGNALLVDGATGDTLHMIQKGGRNTSFFGWDASGVPDVTGDGAGDVIVGDWGFGNNAGAAVLFDGRTGGYLRQLSAPVLQSGAQFGRSVAGLDDVNGDGLGDILVGAAGNPGNAAYLFDGASGAVLHTFTDPVGDNGLGWVVNPAPDVSGDGIMDVVVRGYIPDSLNNAYLFDSASGAHLASLPGNTDFGGGESMVGVPDMNGDGLGEVLIADWTASVRGRPNAGQVLLYLSVPDAQFGLAGIARDAEKDILILSWEAGMRTNAVVEVSGDLSEWTASPAAVTPNGNGMYSTTIPIPHDTRHGYLRIRSH